MRPSLRRVWAEVDLGAIRSNIVALQAHAAPAAMLAVVKADAYGHGAAQVAQAAVAAGARMLGVALVEEGVALRGHGITVPILLLSEPVTDAAATVIDHELTPTVYTTACILALVEALRSAGRTGYPVQLKVDTGMHRVGCEPGDALTLAQLIVASPELDFESVWTHLAVADERDQPHTDEQLDRFDDVVAVLAQHGIHPRMLHAANTAGAIAHKRARYDMVRCGIGMYGVAPAPWMRGAVELEPALSVHAEVSFSKRVRAGEALSYGLRYALHQPSTIVTVPIGYADGVPRALGERGGEVLLRGRRMPIAGTITMDQILIDAGDLPIAAGESVVLLGAQGKECIAAQEWADRIGTIPYEIVCGIGPRVPRRYTGTSA